MPNTTKDGGKGSSLNILEIPADVPLDAEALAQLHAMVSFSMGSGILGEGGLLNIADLEGAALGQATGNTITLDTNAAGNGWYIDPTPWDNSEYLPTSNPNEWVAKEGTAAYGKMDMLSVLLHEYGHALGIDHSAANHDYMDTTLTPGVRRMPSAEDLALMAQLIGEIKTSLSPTLSQGERGQDNAPINPSLPIGATLGAILLGRLRRTDYGSWSPVFDSAQIPAPPPQFEIAANPQLENTAFDGGAWWGTQGDVSFANGAATLGETAATQTRLNQVFVLGEHDHFLSFTLANSALGDQTGPDDAFEIALLDANTGLSLMGSTGLTHNDAILNLQADGTEHKASGITRIDNADGSHTYLVDLSGIPTGTAVNLSFDLIGFGLGAEATNSHITVRDLRLGVPQTADDSITLAEDTPTVIDALSNDLNARQPGFAPVVVSAPAHGQVVVNADGSFSFTPEANWHGEDTFTYKLSDGQADSDLATVTLTVTPVNDAPVAGDIQLATNEDAPLTGSLLAAATDVEGDTLTAAIVAGPQHGQLSVAADGSFTYTPDFDYDGADSFTYRVNDGALDSNTATVTLEIVAVNHAPTLGNLDLDAVEDTALTMNLLAAAADVDGDVLTAAIVAGPLHGQASINADGSFTYTPDADYNGADSFTYKVNDGSLDSNIETVNLSIAAVNDAPTLGDLNLAAVEDTALPMNLLT